MMEGRMLLNRDPVLLKMPNECGMLHVCSSIKHDGTFHNVASHGDKQRKYSLVVHAPRHTDFIGKY